MGRKGLPIDHRVQVSGLSARGRGHSIEDTVAVGVGQHATGEIGELVDVVVVADDLIDDRAARGGVVAGERQGLA